MAGQDRTMSLEQLAFFGWVRCVGSRSRWAMTTNLVN